MRRHDLAGAILLAALVLTCSACGGDGGDEPAAAEPRTLDSFLVRDGEEPGFSPDGEAMTVVGVDALADYWRLSPAAAQQLRDRGFSSFSSRRTAGRDAGGVSEVLLFATPEGAQAQLTHDLRASTIHETLPDTEIRRFTVSDVPGARGWTGTDLHGNPIGTVEWVQGRCVLLLVSEGDLPFVETLSAGARAIYERTGGDCP